MQVVFTHLYTSKLVTRHLLHRFVKLQSLPQEVYETVFTKEGVNKFHEPCLFFEETMCFTSKYVLYLGSRVATIQLWQRLPYNESYSCVQYHR